MKTSLEIHQEATEAARARGEAYIAEHLSEHIGA